MRTILILCLVSLTLLTAPVVLADRGDDADTTDDERRASATARHEAKIAWRENLTANRTAAWESFATSVATLRGSWHENTTATASACHSVTLDKENATKEERVAQAHCVRDGHRAWRILHSDEIRALHTQLTTLLNGWHKHHRGAGIA